MKRLPREESRKRQELIKQYFAEGHTAEETVIKFETTLYYVKKLCRGIRPGNQYTNGLFDRMENCNRIIKQANANFEYVSGFTNVDGKINIKCIVCGNVFEISMITLRKKHLTHDCPYCVKAQKADERERRKQEKQRQREKRNEELKAKRKQEKETKILARYRNAPQISMKQCAICGDMFIEKRNKRYCSKKCLDQNHWAMKDGYRYLFPLEEVFKRDNGICYICGQLCDWNDKEEINGVTVYGNYYPSRDHVIPKSKGGKNTIDNIRLAHRICNSLKATDNPPVREIIA